MESLLKPGRFCTEPNCHNSNQEWLHWNKTFENFIATLEIKEEESDKVKLRLLTNYISPSIFERISEFDSYKTAIEVLTALYVKPKNEIFARHKLASRFQQESETIDEYVQILLKLSKDCNFKSVSAEQNKNDYIRDTFISGIQSNVIRQRLLENKTLSLEDALSQARSLEMAQKQAESYLSSPSFPLNAAARKENQIKPSVPDPGIDNLDSNLSAVPTGLRCFFCGLKKHSRENCPAKNVDCFKCGKRGHFSKVCRASLHAQQVSSKTKNISSDGQISVLSAAAPSSLAKSTIKVLLNGESTDALIDTGSSESFISKNLVHARNIRSHPARANVSMASTSFQSQIQSCCQVELELLGHKYENVKLLVLDNLCTDVIVGHDILRNHSSVEVVFGGEKGILQICGLSSALLEPVSLFNNLLPNCKPIAIKSRRFSSDDSKFIEAEVQKLLSDGIIEPSVSPWRAQVLVTKSENHKKRMVVDYSQTINRYTLLDAYPLPRIDDIVNDVSKFKVFSTIDLRSAYYQIPIAENEKLFTAFEACGGLYQFCRVPFGVTNGVAVFQRTMDMIIKNEKLKNTFAYLDDVTICGTSQEDHDKNLHEFMQAVKKYSLTLNQDKCVFSSQSIKLLGYVVSDHSIKPDPDRLKPLLELPTPNNTASLRRTLGMFSHYSNLIPNFSEKIRPLVESKVFPLTKSSVDAFENLKKEISEATKLPIVDEFPFTVETDASEKTIAATLSQNGRPVAFFSRTLSRSEIHHSSVEKEAQAIVESVRKWRHYLIGRHFTLVTDQKSVAFMFDGKMKSKIKNEKIQRWRLELSCFKYDIIYRQGKYNTVPDALSRVCSVIEGTYNLREIHDSLCHPGVTRFYHWIRSKNIPCTLEEVRRMTRSCPTCAELKPRFAKFEGKLIKATAPFERLNIDFKGPLPSNSRNRYILTVVDEFSRFPFAFPCSEITSSAVINHLRQLFVTFGMPNYIHSDRGAQLLSRELTSFLNSNGIATSHTTPYNPQGNGQVERYNGIIWKTVTLALKSRGLPVTHWESVLLDALHSIRSLLCTATNATPHERMFTHDRKSSNGSSTPTWLTVPGPVLMRNFDRRSKYDPLVKEVELIHANPGYAQVRLPDGRETNVSVRHLARAGERLSRTYPNETDLSPCESFEIDSNDNKRTTHEEVRLDGAIPNEIEESEVSRPPLTQENTRPQRVRRQPVYLKDYITK